MPTSPLYELICFLRRRNHGTWRTAALHDRTPGSGAHQGFLLRRSRAGERRSAAARLPRLLALFGRHRHGTSHGHAQSARRHRSTWHRKEIRGHRAVRSHRLRRVRRRWHAQTPAGKRRQIPREHRAAHRRYAILPVRSRWRRRGVEFSEDLKLEPGSDSIRTRLYSFVLTRFLYANRCPLRSKTLWQSRHALTLIRPALRWPNLFLRCARVKGVDDVPSQHLARKKHLVPDNAASRPSLRRESDRVSSTLRDELTRRAAAAG